MRFSTTRLQDVRLIEMDPISDQRGFFARTFCVREFSEAGSGDRVCPAQLPLTRSLPALCAVCISSGPRMRR